MTRNRIPKRAHRGWISRYQRVRSRIDQWDGRKHLTTATADSTLSSVSRIAAT